MSTVQIPEYTTDSFFGLEDKWIETAQGELTHYHEMGEGTPILFLHGSGTGVSAAANWWLNLPQIAEQARCIAIDTIGYGQTVVAPGTAYGIRAWVDHAIRTLDALGIEKTWVVANPVLTEEGIKQTLSMFVVNKDLITDELVKVRFDSAKNDYASDRLMDVVGARDRDRFEFPLDFEKMKDITVPVLLIHGVQDVVIPVSRSWDILNIVPHADAHIFSQCGHWSQVEKAEEFNTVIKDYLTARGV